MEAEGEPRKLGKNPASYSRGEREENEYSGWRSERCLHLISFFFSFRVSGKKSEGKEAKKSEEPKLRKKPGPKPGWKAKLRCER